MKGRQLIYIHIGVWGLLLLNELGLYYLSHKSEQSFQTIGRQLGIQVCYLIIPVSCFYSSYILVAPQFFLFKKYLRGILYSILILLGIVALRYLIEYHILLPLFGFDNYGGHPWPAADYVENVFFYYFPKYFMYGQLYFFAENWYRDKQLKQELEKERSAAELAFLRSQLNPHFLFNTLNDIYSLTYQKSEHAPEALLKLSELLRYMLREGNTDRTPLRLEVQYIENVIALQRLGAKGQCFIDFEPEGYIADQPVASLLFIAFVENAFKHGMLDDAAHPIKIHLTGAHDHVIFHISNKKNRGQKDKTGGIGLNNVQRRLKLLFGDNYKLDIKDTTDNYSVHLTLPTGL